MGVWLVAVLALAAGVNASSPPQQQVFGGGSCSTMVQCGGEGPPFCSFSYRRTELTVQRTKRSQDHHNHYPWLQPDAHSHNLRRYKQWRQWSATPDYHNDRAGGSGTSHSHLNPDQWSNDCGAPSTGPTGHQNGIRV